nr:class I tRNA ligase family protein [Pseudomonas sp. ERMR1:02]
MYVVNYLAIDGKEDAIMSVPADDQKALELCQRLDIKHVSIFDQHQNLKNSGSINGMSRAEARVQVTDELVLNRAAVKNVRYKMRDWLFSRQRYWGEPFPLYRDTDGQVVKAAYSELPIELPHVKNFSPGLDGTSPLQRAQEWVNCEDASGNPLFRITDTMPGWAGSCWYYLRFMDPHNQAEPFSRQSNEYWNQVDLYVGGAAHATMHLLYARFWHKVLFDVGLVSCDEPFKKLYNQGLVTADAFKDASGRIVAVDEAELRDGGYWLKNTNDKLQVFNTKMSKSLLNVVVPDTLIKEYGVDTFRIYMMFMGPLGQNKKWDIKGIKGCARFLNRVSSLIGDAAGRSGLQEKPDVVSNERIEMLWGKTLSKIDSSFVSLNFNTAIAAFMEFINEAEKNKVYFFERVAKDFIKALFPFAPHVCSEMWERLGHSDIDFSAWPKARVGAVSATKIYINGKYVNDLLDSTGEKLSDIAKARNKVVDALKGRVIIKVIYAPNKVVNFLCGVAV